MENKRGLSSFTSFIIAIIVLIPVLFVILIVITAGSSSIKAAVQSVSAYVSETTAALNTGESVIVGGLSPVLQSDQFMAQFYGSASCISFLNQLSRVGVLTTPSDPSTLDGTYFICFGTYNSNGIGSSTMSSSYSDWSSLPTQQNNATFPNWLDISKYITGFTASDAAGISGSEGALSYFVNTNPIAALSSSCTAFFNATTPVGTDTPAQYVTNLECVTLGAKNGGQIYLAAGAASVPALAPVAFLHGNPATINLQTCTYAGGNFLSCQFDIA